MASAIEDCRIKWAKLLVTEPNLDLQTRLLISLFAEDLKRLELAEHNSK